MNEEKKLKKTFTKEDQLKSLVALAILLGFLAIVLYFASNNGLVKLQKQPLQEQPKQKTEEEQKVLDCSKKLAQEDIDLDDQSYKDCLFIGCGNFFE